MDGRDARGDLVEPPTSPPPRISLLGGFGLSDGRVDVAIAEGPQRLLAFLTLRRRPVRRTLAAGALWPEAWSLRRFHALETLADDLRTEGSFGHRELGIEPTPRLQALLDQGP